MKKFSLMMIALMATVMMSATVVTMDFTSTTELQAMGVTTLPEDGKAWNLTGNSLVKDGVTLTGVKVANTDNRIFNSKGVYSLRTYGKNSNFNTITFAVTGTDTIRGLIFSGTVSFEGVEMNQIATDSVLVKLTCTANSTINNVKVYVNEELPKITVDTISVSEARARIDKGEKQSCYIKGVVAGAPFKLSDKYYTVWLVDIDNPKDSIQAYKMRPGKAATEYTSLEEMNAHYGLLDTVLILAEGIDLFKSTYETTSGYYVETLGKAQTVYANGIYKYPFGAISLEKAEGSYIYDVAFCKAESETPDNAIHYVIKTKNEFGIKGSYKLVATGADSSYVDGEGGISGSVSFTFIGADGSNNKYAVKAIFQKAGVPYVMDTTFSFCGWSKDYQEPFVLEDDRSRGIKIEAIPEGAITVAQALELANSLADNDTSDVVIVTGYVVKVKEAYDTKYNNESFYLDDEIDLGSKDNLQIYRCKLDAEAILGDLLWVEGRLYKFVKNFTTLEMIKGTGHFAKLSTSIEEVVAKLPNKEKAQKIFVNGNIYIVRGGMVYGLQGNVIK